MKILYVTTISRTMGFFPQHIKMLQNLGHTVELAANMTTPLQPAVAALNCKFHQIDFSRSPLSKDNFTAYRQIKKLLQDGQFDIVHTHTPNASALTRLAARKLRKTGLKVFYTAHGFHFYKGAPLKNWLLYYPVEWLCAHWTDSLLTMNQEDYALAEKHMHAQNVYYTPGVGIDSGKFSNAQADRKEYCNNLHIPEDATIILSVGELIQRKNHETVIRALKALNDPKLYYLIVGNGKLETYLSELITELNLQDKVMLLGYRTDVPQLCRIADIFAFPSFQEGLPVALMEAMASGLPCACSRIRGNVDLIDDGKGGFLTSPRDIDGLKNAILQLAQNSNLRNEMGKYNQEKIKEFSDDVVIKKVKEIYAESLK